VAGGTLPKHGRVENGSLLSYVVLMDGTQNDRQFEDKERTIEELIFFFIHSLYLDGCVSRTSRD
jgi:hypothetical protein